MSKMKPFKQLITYEEALARIRKNIKPVTQTETVSIENALDRVLAEDVKANMSVPPFDRAAMDGYAVKAEDTFGANHPAACSEKVSVTRLQRAVRFQGVLMLLSWWNSQNEATVS
jgi:molybdopterin biosynthesis enzyme